MKESVRQSDLIVLLLLLIAGAVHAQETLRVCADPNNLPFSNRAGQGFENKIAALLAKDMKQTLEYEWHAQRRGFLRNTILAGKCNFIAGITRGIDMVETTQPYYRSTYVFVTRRSSKLTVDSLDAPILSKLRVGVQVIGDDYTNTPPVHALARRGIVSVRGYQVVGDYQTSSPPSAIIHAVTSGEIDVGIAWGPMAGYFAALSTGGLQIQPLKASEDATLPLAYDISFGVRPGNLVLRRKLDAAITRNRRAIDGILRDYHVPLVGLREQTGIE
jgi:mxaJ protein